MAERVAAFPKSIVIDKRRCSGSANAYTMLLPVFVFLLSLAVAGAQAPTSTQEPCTGFVDGVASGDPLPDRVIIWTRYTPPGNSGANVEVDWFMDTSPSINPTAAAARGSVIASPSGDYTVKADVTGLQPGMRYYYFFQTGNFSSILGTTKTAPPENAALSIRFSQMSCASWRWGYFNVYNMTSRVLDLDFMVFLGDWIYEYGDEKYPPNGEGVAGRAPLQPPTELATLQDYRTRHRLFRTDAALVEMMRRAPIIAIWDDHDVTADNAWENGTANPVPDVTYHTRKCAAVQAWHEYLPIRSTAINATGPITEGASGSGNCSGLLDIYRTFRFGTTMTLAMVEQRVVARDEQFNYSAHPYIKALEDQPPEAWDSLTDLQDKRQSYYQALEDPNREMIGQEQMRRLASDLSSSAAANVTWQVLGNTVVMGPLNTPDVETAIEEQGPLAQTLLSGILGVATSGFAEVLPASFGGTARALIGTGRYHDPVIVDGWSGYQHERNQVYDILANTANPVVLSGDIHNAFVWRLVPNNSTTPIAIEFTTASVTSPGVDLLVKRLPGDINTLMDVADRGLHISNNNTLMYSNIRQRGSIYHTVSPRLWHADLSFVSTANEPVAAFECQTAFELVPGAANELQNATCTLRGELFFDLYQQGDPLQTSAAGTPTLFTGAVPGKSPSKCPSSQHQQQGDAAARETGSSADAAGGAPPATGGAAAATSNGGGQVEGSGQYIPAMTSGAVQLVKGSAGFALLMALVDVMLY